MTSPTRATANRANAQRSTGPRTREGKAQARLNALKHGLAVPTSARPDLAADVAQLAQAIVGEAADHPSVTEAAVRVAEAMVDVLRVRKVPAHMWAQITRNPAFQQSTPPPEPLPARPVLQRFSVAAHTRAYLNGTDQALYQAEIDHINRQIAYEAEVRRVKHQRAETKQQAQQLASAWEQLERLERYERRALSRRRTAIRAFDEAWAVACHTVAEPPIWQNEPKEDVDVQSYP